MLLSVLFFTRRRSKIEYRCRLIGPTGLYQVRCGSETGLLLALTPPPRWILAMHGQPVG